MCKIKCRFARTTEFTGYKVVIKRNGKYYSPATGIEYKPGPVPIFDENTERDISVISVFNDLFKNFNAVVKEPF